MPFCNDARMKRMVIRAEGGRMSLLWLGHIAFNLFPLNCNGGKAYVSEEGITVIIYLSRGCFDARGLAA